ncbi:MAG: hypothetical protein RMK29_10475 [Myxococcales bacterium]|nr:hypothetical protein [Myxococcales bacterium]
MQAVRLLYALLLSAWVARADASCPQGPGPQHLPPLLGPAEVKRSARLITDFDLSQVASEPEAVGTGGITTQDQALRQALGNCSDSPTGERAAPGARYDDRRTRLRVEVVGVEPAGRSGRRWEGVRCSYRISALDDPTLHVTLGPEHVPAFNELSGLEREDGTVYATLQFNGYAHEIGRRGNRVLALDLCTHTVRWRSPDLWSNAALLLYRDYLITGYGFTREPAHVRVLNRWTGEPVQVLPLPKAPRDLRLQGGKLYVRLYDGYAAFPLRVP